MIKTQYKTSRFDKRISLRSMANVSGDVTQRHNPVIGEIDRSCEWLEDSKGHYLLVDLSGFKKDQVKMQTFTRKVIKVNGERPVNDIKRVHFEKNFDIPKDSNADAITAKFDGKILYITFPKPEAEPVGMKDQIVNGTTKENIPQKPNDEEAKKKDNQVLNDGLACQRKKKEGSYINVPITFSEDAVWRGKGETRYLGSAMEILSKNKEIVVTVMLAFSLGMLISRKF